MTEKFDEVLIRLGTGKWNFYIILSTAYWMCLMPYHAYSGAFLAPYVNHTCNLPPGALVNYSTEENTDVDACWYRVMTSEGDIERLPCTEWDFDNLTYVSTLTSEFQLVCDRKHLRPTFQSIYYLSAIVGSQTNGILADKYGRKTMIVLSTSVYIIMAISLSWIRNFSFLMVARAIMGLVQPAAIHSCFTLAMEGTQPEHRALVGILVFLPWSISLISWGGVAYFIRSWRWLQFTVALPTLLFLPMIWYVDESPRWLIVNGYHERARRVLKRAALLNKASMPSEIELNAVMIATQYEGFSEENRTRISNRNCRQRMTHALQRALVLFRTRRIRSLTLAMCFMFLVLGIVYFGLSLGGDNFGSDPFIYMALTGVMEIPGATLTALLVQRWGRRWPIAACFFISGSSLLTLPFVSSEQSWLSISFVMLGKLTITSAYRMSYVLANEAFPTEIRSRGFGTASTVAMVGSSAAPYLIFILGDMYRWLPSVVFGTGGIVASLVTFIVPETLGIALPETLAAYEAEKDFRNKKSVPDQENYIDLRKSILINDK